MAQLKDTIVSGNLRVTDTTLTDTLQVTTIKAPTSSGGTTYGPGTSGQVLKSNGTTTYWASDSNTDEKVKSTKLAQSTAAATYYPTLMTGAATAGVSIFESMKFLHTPGTTSAVGNSRLVLGNATASGTADNEEGLVRLYSPGTAYHTIKGASTSSNVDHTLPTTSGTILNTGTTSVTAVYASTGTHIATVKVNGSDTKIYAPTPQTPTSYSAGTGLSLSGTTFNHSNSVTAGTAKGDDSKTLTFGGTFTIPSVTYDAQGHITAKGTTTMTMPSNPNTDTKVNVTLGTTTKAYLLGTSTTPTSTAQAVTSIADTSVYLGTGAGSLYATTFYENGTALSSKYAALSHSHDELTSKALTAATFDSTSGNFFFRGGSLFGGTDNFDWVGIQGDASNDKFQLVAGGANGVFYRENDDTWGEWYSLLTNNMITGSSGITVTPNTIKIGGDAGTTINAGLEISHSNSITAVTTVAFKKVAYDANGHITGSENVAKSDITALGIPTQDTKYGISGAYGSNNNTWVTTITAGGTGTTSTVPTASTSVYGITKLYNGVDSTSTGLAATANAVKTAYDKANHSHPYLPLAGGTLTGRVTTSKFLNYIVKGTGTAGADKGSGQNPRYVPAKWTFDTGQTASDGDIIFIKIPVAGHDYGVYISINNGTSYHPAVISGTSRLTTHYGNGNYAAFTFRSDGSAASMIPLAGNTNGARVTVTGGVWQGIDYYDSGNTYDRTSMQTRIYAGGVGVFRYSICAMNNAQRMESFTTTGDASGSPTTSKTFNTSAKFAFPPVIMYNNANAAYSSGSVIGNNVLYEQFPSVDMRYSCNKTSSSGFTQYKPIFIECTFDDDGYFSITSNGFVQTFTSGKYYILVGCMYSTSVYQLALFAQHPMYYYDGTNLKYTPAPHTHPYLPLSGGTLSGTVTFGTSSLPLSVGMEMYTKNSSSYVNAIKWSYGDTWGTYGASIGYHNQYSSSTPGTSGSITILPYQTTTQPWDGTVGLHIKKDHGYIDGNEILVHKNVTSSTLNGSSGTFSFSGSGDPWPGYDWVGLQIGDDADKFQITASGGNLLVRQNDNGGSSSSGWTEWKTLSDTTHTHSEYVPFSGGTMDNSVTLSFPKSDGDGRYTSINTNGVDIHGSENFGWAMGLRYYIGDTSQNMEFGGYGSGGVFNYLYIGAWDDPIVKITPDKVSEFTGNVVLHSSSGNSPSLTFQHGTTIDSLLDWRMMAVNSDLKLYSSTSGSTESWSNILTFGGGGVTINKQIGGLWVTDYKNTSYPMIRDNGENLWIGTQSTSSYHHNGGTYISAGWDHSASLPTAANQTLYGNETIKISVPRYSTNSSGTGSWNGANYNVIHDGPQLTTTRYLINSSTAIPPIHRAMFPNVRSNKLSFIPASNVVVEYSTNNGSTWADMSVTVSGVNNAISDAMKAQLTTGRWDATIPVGPNNSSVARTTSMQTRITFTPTDRDCMIDQIYMQINPGYHAFQYTIQYATTTSPSDSDWIDWKENITASAWMYEDAINGEPIRLGNKVKKLRFIFKQTSVNASYNKNLSTIKDIAAYGGQAAWTSPNEMFRSDHMYSWDYDKNVDFPADVSGNSLTSPTVNISSGSYKASVNASGLTQNRTITIGDVSGDVGIVKVLHDNSSYPADQSVSITTNETFKYFIVTIKPNNTFGEKTEIIRITKDTTVSTKYISFTGDIGPAPSQPTITLGGYIAHQYNTTSKTYTIEAGHAANYILCNNNVSSVSADSITLTITKIVGLA